MIAGWHRKGAFWLPHNDPHIFDIGVDSNAAYRAAMSWVTDWSCAIDGGAHVGGWTVPLAAKFKQVIAVEIAANVVACLRENARKLLNVTVMHNALGDQAEMLGCEPDGAPDSSVFRVIEAGTVPVLRIDDLDLPSLGLIKLDLQGYDYFALKGSVETLKRCRPVIVYEWKDRCAHRYGVQKEQVTEFLHPLGAKPVIEDALDNVWVFS